MTLLVWRGSGLMVKVSTRLSQRRHQGNLDLGSFGAVLAGADFTISDHPSRKRSCLLIR